MSDTNYSPFRTYEECRLEPFVAYHMSKKGWCWFIEFKGFSYREEHRSGVTPAFFEAGIKRMSHELEPLRPDIDFAFIGHSEMMFRIEQDAIDVWNRYHSADMPL